MIVLKKTLYKIGFSEDYVKITELHAVRTDDLVMISMEKINKN